MSQNDPNSRQAGSGAPVAKTWPEPSCPKCGLVLAPDSKVCPNDGTKLSDDNPQAVPGYHFIRLFGSGGMGNVYEAEQIVLNKKVAIKTLKSHLIETSAFVRFQKEAKAASSLKHPNIVSVYDCGISKNGEPYMIMDLVVGETVADLLQRTGALSIEESTRILKEICAGVKCAHEKGILHRDLKPSNVILEETAQGKLPRILDFGIAKVFDYAGAGATMTNTGEVVGTPQYMSPEQASGLKLDQRSDIYSIGCIFYEMLTGLPPITGKTPVEALFKQVTEIPGPLSQTAMRKFPEWLESLVARVLAKDPAARFQTIDELLEALDNHNAAPPSQMTSGRSVRKSLVLPVVATLAVLAAAVFVCNFIFGAASRKQGADATSAVVPSPPPSASSSAATAAGAAGGSIGFDDAGVTNRVFGVYLRRHAQDSTLSVGKLGDARDLTDITDDGLIPLERCKQVRILELGDCHRLTAKGMEHLVGLPNLESLNIQDTNLGDDAMQILAKLPLKEVNLSRTKITDSGLKALSASPTLIGMNLKSTVVSGEGMKHIAKMPNLTGVGLDSCKRIDDKAVAALTPLKLKDLRLGSTAVTDKVVKSILKMPNLILLTLSSTEVTDVCLDQLSQKKSLKRLEIVDCPGISEGAMARFRAALPDCHLDLGRKRN